MLPPRNRLRPVLFVLALVASGLPAAGLAPLRADEPLRWKFTAGDDLVFRIEQKFEMSMQVAGQDAPAPGSGTTTIDMGFHVDKVDEAGVARVSMNVSRMKMAMQMQGMDIAYDSADTEEKNSDNPVTAMMAKAFAAMGKLSYSVSVNPRGEFSEIEVPAGSLAALKGLPGMDQFGGLFDEKTFKESFNQISGNGWLILPEQPPAVGGVWKQEGTMQNPVLGKQTTLSEFRYEGPTEQDGKKLDAIAVALTMDFEQEVDAKLPIKIDIVEQEQKGTIYFDRALGRMDHGELKLKMKMEIETMGQQITQTIESTTRTSLIPASTAGSPGEESEKAATDKPAESAPSESEKP